ncbi:hypothetical protein PIB30_102988, partial [Stylosanthes scabra]|nr:hypothetical protein [Stylosanthes scabra]
MASSDMMKKYVAIVVMTMLVLAQGHENNIRTTKFELEFSFKQLICHGKCLAECAFKKPNPVFFALCLVGCMPKCMNDLAPLNLNQDSNCIAACALYKPIEDKL